MDEAEINKISERVKESGAVSINNFLNSKQFELANNILMNISGKEIEKGDKHGYFSTNLKSTIIKLAKFDFNIIKKSFLLKKIAKNLQLEKIARKILNSETDLHMIDSYYNKKSNEKIIEWHNDIGWKETRQSKDMDPNNASIKFFFYMTDVESENGSFAYLPYSNHIVRAITTLMLNKKIEFKFYWKLEDLRNLVAKNPVKDLLIDKVGIETVNNFLSNSEFIKEEKKDTFAYDFEMDRGGVVIFDALGVHRGGSPSKTPRLVLRYHYRKKI